jgi:hypothetical protein
MTGVVSIANPMKGSAVSWKCHWLETRRRICQYSRVTSFLFLLDFHANLQEKYNIGSTPAFFVQIIQCEPSMGDVKPKMERFLYRWESFKNKYGTAILTD